MFFMCTQVSADWLRERGYLNVPIHQHSCSFSNLMCLWFFFLFVCFFIYQWNRNLSLAHLAYTLTSLKCVCVFCESLCDVKWLYACWYVTSGNQAEFTINNTKAGPGSVSVTIEGPSKVKMDCQECPEGYKVQYTPMAPGNYLISIKYGGPNHITGSPFKAKVTGSVELSPVWVVLSVLLLVC